MPREMRVPADEVSSRFQLIKREELVHSCCEQDEIAVGGGARATSRQSVLATDGEFGSRFAVEQIAAESANQSVVAETIFEPVVIRAANH